jgi:hypothetical protein
MSNVLETVFVDLVGPPVSAEWLNTVEAHILGANVPTTIIATAGQTVFTVPATAVNTVYINGVYQIYGSSYTRTNSTTITFSEAVPVTAKVVIL